MFSIFYKNLPIKIFSIVLAVILWAAIVTVQHAPYQFTDELEIKPFNLSEQLSLVGPLPKVKIQVVTTQEIFQGLTAQDFDAYIDLKNAEKGPNTASVLVTAKTSNVTVSSVQPSQISFDLENVSQKTVPVLALTKGSPRQGYKAEKPVLPVDKVLIKGAESVIKKITDVKAVIKFDGSEMSSFNKEVSLQVLDSSGDEIKEIVIDPEKIIVPIVINQLVQEKTVGIKVDLKGSPTAGFVESVTTSPVSIVIKGESQYINLINYIDTAALDITSESGTVDKYIPLNLPKNVTLADPNIDRIHVIIEIKPYK